MRKRIVFTALIMILVSSKLLLSSAGSINNVDDVYARITEEFSYGNYEEVIHIYENDMQYRLPFEQRDSVQYYHYAKAVIAVFADNNLEEASHILVNLPEDFTDTKRFKHYVLGLLCERDNNAVLAQNEFRQADGIFDSVSHLIFLQSTLPVVSTPNPGGEATYIGGIPCAVFDETGWFTVRLHQNRGPANIRMIPDYSDPNAFFAEAPAYTSIYYTYKVKNLYTEDYWYHVNLDTVNNGEIIYKSGYQQTRTGYVWGNLVDATPDK